MTRVLLTGANGFLGSELVKVIGQDSSIELIKLVRLAQTSDTNLVACDLTNNENVKEILVNVLPDVILHTAAFVPKTKSDYENDLSNANLLMVKNLLAHSNAIFINISSMTVYGLSDKVIRAESDDTDPQSAYGKSKLKIEEFLLNNKSMSISIRIPGLFGFERKTGLIYNILKSLSNDEHLVLPTEPLLWSAMDVSDVANSIHRVMQAFANDKYSSNVINVAYPDILSINKLVNTCEDIFEKRIPYSVEHPDFAFCMDNLEEINAVPENSFKDSLLKLKANYGF